MMPKLIVSMTTWPPRFRSAAIAMKEIVTQRDEEGLQNAVHCVLVLSEEEVCASEHRSEACRLIDKMEKMGVEVIIDKGNIKSHKKLIPVIEKYPDSAILVVDDDNRQECGWLREFMEENIRFPNDILYGQSNSHLAIKGDFIEYTMEYNTQPGKVTKLAIPASGAAGTLYPAHTFTDERFFNRQLFMSVCPTSDETWQFAFGIMAECTYRCLQQRNYPYVIGANQQVALFKTNEDRYEWMHNQLARIFPEYLQKLKEL